MAGMKETQLTADVELLASGPVGADLKSKQQSRPPISMNFEVSSDSVPSSPPSPLNSSACIYDLAFNRK